MGNHGFGAWMTLAVIETTLEVWASSLLDVKLWM